MVADVLGFYQERIANEGFLGTATERRSVHELARLIGYEPKPGVAARAWLAFDVDDRVPAPPGSALPPSAIVPAGTRVQSVPGQDELPQTFETSTELVAHAERNEMRPRLSVPAELDAGADRIYLEGLATDLGPGDVIVIFDKEDGCEAKPVQRVVPDHEHDRTRIDFIADPGEIVGTPAAGGAAGTVSPTPVGLAPSEAKAVLGQTWSDSTLGSFFTVNSWSIAAFLAYAAASPASPEQGPAEPGVYVLRGAAQRVRRQRAEAQRSPQDGLAGRLGRRSTQRDHRQRLAGRRKAKRCITTTRSTSIRRPARPGRLLARARGRRRGVYARTESKTAGQPLPRRLRDQRQGDERELTGPPVPRRGELGDFTIRATTVHAESERLEQAELLLDETFDAEDEELMLDRLVLGLEPGQPIGFSGEDAELDGVRWNEVVTLVEATHSGGTRRCTSATSSTPTSAPP